MARPLERDCRLALSLWLWLSSSLVPPLVVVVLVMRVRKDCPLRKSPMGRPMVLATPIMTFRADMDLPLEADAKVGRPSANDGRLDLLVSSRDGELEDVSVEERFLEEDALVSVS